MNLKAFRPGAPGTLVPISGVDPRHGEWVHRAFVPDPLPRTSPELGAATYRAVANARASLAALDSTARRLPNPRLFRRPSLQAEAQSTSALEGIYASLSEVLTADEERPPSADLRGVLNYVQMGNEAFGWIEEGRPLTVGMVSELQAVLMRGTSGEAGSSGRVRTHQVVVGSRGEHDPARFPVHAARYVPPPPGLDLESRLRDLLDWIQDRSLRSEIDPVVASALAHYQFEALHPFHDGNGRIGRFLIVVHLLKLGVLFEPTLTVSPWFEARRGRYYDSLLGVSVEGDWDAYVRLFATGLESSADATHGRMNALIDVHTGMRDRVRTSSLRADTAHALVDHAVANVSFTVRSVERALGVSYGRARTLVGQLEELGILAPLPGSGPTRRFHAPEVLRVLLREQDEHL